MIRKFLMSIFIIASLGVSSISSFASDNGNITEEKTDICIGDDESLYDFDFEDTIEKDGITYKLDGISYEKTNLYEKEYLTNNVEYEVVITVDGIDEETKSSYKPETETIVKSGFTYKFDKVKFKNDEPLIVDMVAYQETPIYEHGVEPIDFPKTYDYTYDDGEVYTLPFVNYEVSEEKWYNGYTVSGTISNYDAPTYLVGDYEFIHDGKDIELTNELTNRILRELGYSNNYNSLNAYYTSDVYEDADGITYRDFVIECEVYGQVYRLNYSDSVEFPLYIAEIMYSMSDEEKAEIEALKEQYEVVATATYIPVPAEEEKSNTSSSTIKKVVIGTAIILGIIALIALIIYFIKGGRKPTDYKSKRDIRNDYKNL